MLGFVTFGTPEQIHSAGQAVESMGLRCRIIRADDGRTELMVIFDQTTTQKKAYSVYRRVFFGEFGTMDTAYMLAPVTALKSK